MRKVICWIFIILIAILTLVVCVNVDDDIGPIFLCVGGIIICPLLVVAGHKRETDGIRYLAEDKTLYLRERIPPNRDYVRLVNIPATYKTDHDAQLVYTGATVGGIHTGGFHIEEAYTSSKATATDRYAIWFSSGEDHFIVKKIVLFEDDLIQEAKRHPQVSKFLQGEELILKYDNDNTQLTELERSAINRAMKNGDTTAANNIGMRATMAQFMVKSDAKAVLNWISGK